MKSDGQYSKNFSHNKNYDVELSLELAKLITYDTNLENIESALNLIKKGADPNIQNLKNFRTILWPVINLNDSSMLRKFVDVGCNIFHKDLRCKNILDTACGMYFCDIVDWLLSNGYSINEKIGEKKEKRIHQICSIRMDENQLQLENNPINLIKVFIKHGVDLFEENENGELPIDVAKKFNLGENNGKSNSFIEFLEEAMQKQKESEIEYGLITEHMLIEQIDEILIKMEEFEKNIELFKKQRSCISTEYICIKCKNDRCKKIIIPPKTVGETYSKIYICLNCNFKFKL